MGEKGRRDKGEDTPMAEGRRAFAGGGGDGVASQPAPSSVAECAVGWEREVGEIYPAPWPAP
jgi:hypothetical protein